MTPVSLLAAPLLACLLLDGGRVVALSFPAGRGAGLSYCPGDFSDNSTSDDGLLRISNGMSCKRIASTGERVALADGSFSAELFHDAPDGAAVFAKEDGGWYYVSNAENYGIGNNWDDGGVGSIEFDAAGNVIGYKRVANYMQRNCGGGKSPWNTWITCEEVRYREPGGSYIGQVHQVDPSGVIPPRVTSMGRLGQYESFAYDNTTTVPTFYVTRDEWNGVLTRFTPNAVGMNCYNQENDADRWCTLEHGDIDYLWISGGEQGVFMWTKSYEAASANAEMYYPNAEGIDSSNGKVFFVSKELKRLVILDLAANTYTYSSTQSGAFDEEPDQVGRLVRGDSSILYFCEDGGETAGVHGRTADGKFYTIMEGRTAPDGVTDETTGLAWSNNGLHMYVTYQWGGFVYDCTRDDGLPFSGDTLDIKYHAVEA